MQVTRSFDVFFDMRLNKRLSKNRDAGDLRRHLAHYDVIVMWFVLLKWTLQYTTKFIGKNFMLYIII